MKSGLIACKGMPFWFCLFGFVSKSQHTHLGMWMICSETQAHPRLPRCQYHPRHYYRSPAEGRDPQFEAASAHLCVCVCVHVCPCVPAEGHDPQLGAASAHLCVCMCVCVCVCVHVCLQRGTTHSLGLPLLTCACVCVCVCLCVCVHVCLQRGTTHSLGLPLLTCACVCVSMCACRGTRPTYGAASAHLCLKCVFMCVRACVHACARYDVCMCVPAEEHDQ